MVIAARGVVVAIGIVVGAVEAIAAAAIADVEIGIVVAEDADVEIGIVAVSAAHRLEIKKAATTIRATDTAR